MKKNLTEALNKVEMTYQDVVEIANDMMSTQFQSINFLINDIDLHMSTLSIDSVRDYMLKLQLKAYEISELKDKASLKSECAEAVRKEKYATSLLGAEGPTGVKENTALLASSEELIVELLYQLIADLVKTKLDQLHRLTDVMKSILMSKMQEAKYLTTSTTDYIPPTTNGRVILNE